MKKLSNFSLIFAVVFLISNQLQAQKTVEEFTVTYEMKIDAPDNPMAEMMGGSTMQIAFRGNASANNISMMNGMAENKTIVDVKEEKGVMLLSVPMMQKYMAVELGPEEFKQMEEERNTQDAKPEIAYAKQKTKTIAGYDCYEAMVKPADSEDVMVFYITEKLSPKAKTQWQKDAGGMEGFPLSIKTEREGVTVTFTATEVTAGKPDKGLFNMEVPENYEKMTLEEMKQMGQGGGMGF